LHGVLKAWVLESRALSPIGADVASIFCAERTCFACHHVVIGNPVQAAQRLSLRGHDASPQKRKA
jgi:hypothetical protein